jgi:hypothetical protein
MIATHRACARTAMFPDKLPVCVDGYTARSIQSHCQYNYAWLRQDLRANVKFCEPLQKSPNSPRLPPH